MQEVKRLIEMKTLLFGLALVAPYTVTADPTQEAIKHASKALYVELELNKMVNKQIKKIEKKLPKPVKKYAPAIGVAAQIVIEQKASYKWEF